MTRSFLLVSGLALGLCVPALVANERKSITTAAVLCSLALGIMLTYAIVEALKPEAERQDAIRDPRKIEARAHEALLAAFPAPSCWHVKGSASVLCDCAIARGAR